jgi:hypothetical protein
MTDFVACPVVMRTLPNGWEVAQVGDHANVGTQKFCFVLSLAEIDANPRHYLRDQLPTFRAKGAVAIVLAKDAAGRPVNIMLTAAQFALGAAERARYAKWADETAADWATEQAAERAYDLAYNEGGEGYNPHRVGSARSYARQNNGDREYPEGA